MFKTVCRLSHEDQAEISRKLGSFGTFDTYTVHKFVYTLFPEELHARFSYNAEYEDNNGRLVVIHSDIEPNLNGFEKYDIVIHRVSSPKNGERHEFLLTVNSAKKISRQNFYKPVKSAEFPEWLKSRAENAGFRFDEKTLKIIQHYDKNFTDKLNRKRRAYVTVCTGVLDIEDQEKFADAYVGGIGREKTYGIGLISIK